MSVMWCMIDYILKKFFLKYLDRLRWFISFLFLIFGYGMDKYNVLDISNIPTIFTSYSLFTIGLYIHKGNLKKEKKGECNGIKIRVIAAISFLSLVAICRWGDNINMVHFENPIIFLAASLLGWELLYAVAVLMAKIGWISSVLSYLGRNTMPIVMFHFMSFKVINLIEVRYYDLPLYRVASFPIYKGMPFWWIAYAFSGIILPLIVNEAWKQFRKGVK